MYIISQKMFVVNIKMDFFVKNAKKDLTSAAHGVIIYEQSVGKHGRTCRNGGIGRRPGLKIP